MPLKTFVKVGTITNLNDARYCAGMGVDLLGFNVIKGHRDYVSPDLFQDIRGWIAGPGVVAELYGATGPIDLREIMASYSPDYLEMTIDQFRALANEITLPCIVSGAGKEPFPENLKQVAIALVDTPDREWNAAHRILQKVERIDQLETALTHSRVSGIALNGSPEEKAGTKTHDALPDVLEALETD